MTDDIKLRTLEKDDLPFLHNMLNNPDVMDFWFEESYMSRDNLEGNYEKNKDNENIRRFILTNAHKEKLGFVGLYAIKARHRNAEFAIMIDPVHQGKGYGPIATKLAMDYAFSVLNLHKLYLLVAKANHKANHVYEKVGFQMEGEMIEHFFINGAYHDALMMSIFQEDYWKMKS